MQRSKLKNTPKNFRRKKTEQANQNLTIFDKIYEVVKTIPAGQVATYGQIADEVNSLKISAKRISPQLVGWALHANKSSEVPCHRVVDRSGRLAPNFAFDGWREQKNRLLAEGLTFKDVMHVNLDKMMWNPNRT